MGAGQVTFGLRNNGNDARITPIGGWDSNPQGITTGGFYICRFFYHCCPIECIFYYMGITKNKRGKRGGLMGRKFGVSFSWKRALGISSTKQKIARMTGIPTIRQGRQRKLARSIGCVMPVMAAIPIIITTIIQIF